ncbi:putative dual-specificity RNA methyltransferase RlmN [Thalassoglobus neptunius]|uniref:Probable dual-specificity RNA methyltransferase RlmN n=1 Tax=Thalassoglobus neptunius TaxID=1938619 RepID=A0A5C5WWJ2_9PLAN|nr:23S rRNA (adenine(2503)-C(2))-methyltransferase RlmN [Thalassoglobus neptunius]TWT55324.1 putative dual-specificity RNA methyltransferase RlmN [Thalassoglobus neptunius]
MSLGLLNDLSRDELIAWVEQAGHASYRADQIRRWIFGKRVNDFDEMHDIPASLRSALKEHFQLLGAKVVRHQVSVDGTEKLLLEFDDKEQTECVLMRENDRNTICVSTQVGCAMGCVFCASGLLGVKRDLTTGEILSQILLLDRLLSADQRITNVVIMGMGEPLANLRNLTPALLTLNEKGGMGLGARRITVSTVGLPEKIAELAALNIPFNLAVSLHAPTNELRDQIVPVNKKIRLERILKAADDYFDKTGRRITYEYVLLAGINDADEHAAELGRLLKSRNAHVNLIPMNDVSSLDMTAPSAPRTDQFVNTLRSWNINATVRKRKGADIDAACGQLRLEELTQLDPAAESPKSPSSPSTT